MLSTKLFKQQVIPLFFSVKGRISRGLFWKTNLLLLLVYFSLFLIFVMAEQALAITSGQLGFGGLIIMVFYWYVVFVLTVKRLHDINWSGWLAIPCMLTGILWLIVGLIVGKSGENKHGANSVEYERDRLFINRGKNIPPPPPPLDNPVSKVVLCLMMLLPIPSLVVAGLAIPKGVETPALDQTEEDISNETMVAPILEESKKEILPFSLNTDDQYQKIEESEGISAYYIVTRADGTIEHYALDGALQWSNVEHEAEQLLEEEDIQSSQSEQNIQEKNSSPTLSYLPFVGERGFNFMGGSGTEYTIKINSDGHTQIKLCGVDECSNIYNGKYTNPIRFDDGSGFLFGDGKIYSLPEHGKVAEEGCQNYESDKCVSDLYSY